METLEAEKLSLSFGQQPKQGRHSLRGGIVRSGESSSSVYLLGSQRKSSKYVGLYSKCFKSSGCFSGVSCGHVGVSLITRLGQD